MSKAPKCKLCGHNHWLKEPHRFMGVPLYEEDGEVPGPVFTKDALFISPPTVTKASRQDVTEASLSTVARQAILERDRVKEG